MSRLKEFKDNLKKSAKRKVWRTGKKLGKSYLEYKAVKGVLRYAKKKIRSKASAEEQD
jgi:hypothetical protein